MGRFRRAESTPASHGIQQRRTVRRPKRAHDDGAWPPFRSQAFVVVISPSDDARFAGGRSRHHRLPVRSALPPRTSRTCTSHGRRGAPTEFRDWWDRTVERFVPRSHTLNFARGQARTETGTERTMGGGTNLGQRLAVRNRRRIRANHADSATPTDRRPRKLDRGVFCRRRGC